MESTKFLIPLLEDANVVLVFIDIMEYVRFALQAISQGQDAVLHVQFTLNGTQSPVNAFAAMDSNWLMEFARIDAHNQIRCFQFNSIDVYAIKGSLESMEFVKFAQMASLTQSPNNVYKIVGIINFYKLADAYAGLDLGDVAPASV